MNCHLYSINFVAAHIFVYFEYIQIWVFNLHSMAVHALRNLCQCQIILKFEIDKSSCEKKLSKIFALTVCMQNHELHNFLEVMKLMKVLVST